MIDALCGSLNRNSPCMLNGSCSKPCPRPLYEDTQTVEDGYPQYCTNLLLMVVLQLEYNHVLSWTFKAHINVELCDSVKYQRPSCVYIGKRVGWDIQTLAVLKLLRELSASQFKRDLSIDTSFSSAWKWSKSLIYNWQCPRQTPDSS